MDRDADGLVRVHGVLGLKKTARELFAENNFVIAVKTLQLLQLGDHLFAIHDHHYFIAPCERAAA